MAHNNITYLGRIEGEIIEARALKTKTIIVRRVKDLTIIIVVVPRRPLGTR